MPLTTKSITTGAFVIVVPAIILIAASRNSPPPSGPQTVEFFHSAEGTYSRIGEVRTTLTEALQQKDLQTIHDQMYYLEGLLDAFEEKLSADARSKFNEPLNAVRKATTRVDRHAGKNNLSLTSESLAALFATWDDLEKIYQNNFAATP